MKTCFFLKKFNLFYSELSKYSETLKKTKTKKAKPKRTNTKVVSKDVCFVTSVSGDNI